MKKTLGLLAAACCISAAPAFAGVDVFFDIGVPRQVAVAPTPVSYYRYAEPRWHDRREFFERHHEYRERHENFGRHGWR